MRRTKGRGADIQAHAPVEGPRSPVKETRNKEPRPMGGVLASLASFTENSRFSTEARRG